MSALGSIHEGCLAYLVDMSVYPLVHSNKKHSSVANRCSSITIGLLDIVTDGTAERVSQAIDMIYHAAAKAYVPYGPELLVVPSIE